MSAQNLMPSASAPSTTGQATGATPASATSNSPGAGAITPVSIAGPPRAPSSATPCCESGRPVLTDPITGQTVCSCQYDAHLLNYQRLAASTGLPLGMYGPAAAAAYGAAAGGEGFLPIPPEQLQSAFYSPTANGFDLKENLEAWRNLPYAAAASMYYPYDGGALAGYPFANGYGMDLNGARRKNATRETTSTLKAWLSEHRKNPYPTKGEKIMLAIITKMTLTQVSTWFANARRRLKKENKMTWSPRNRCDDDDDDGKDGSGSGINDRDGRDGETNSHRRDRDEGDSDIVDIEEDSNPGGHSGKRRDTGSPLSDVGSLSDIGDSDASQSANNANPLLSHSSHLHHTIPLNKPRIWSIVDTATSNNSSSLLPLPPNAMKQAMASNAGPGLGPISPSVAAIAANRAARLDYLSPYSKPGAPHHWYNAGNFAGGPPGAAFSPLYPCPPSAMMGHLTVPPGAHNSIPPHIAAAAAESSLNRLRSAAAAVAGVSVSGSSQDNIAAINKTITSIGERTSNGTNINTKS
ncbi:unnamed protein product [Medioppia subpectinata]|uniref:Homeobox domain-containing protein n=1 Tax=Medioppia subpectinata TaxID=1979941 RepID=A0A7R9KN84_9ACAR|nr:unnamed protein product [Medioppia subpectinata]CAG2106374.1 unnamed protein product [Medioppia subpectinata]